LRTDKLSLIVARSSGSTRNTIPIVVLLCLVIVYTGYYHFFLRLPHIPKPENSRAQWGLEIIGIKLPDGTRLAAEVAWTPKQQEKGMMFRTVVPSLTGMLFVYEKEAYQSIWMKNTLVNLDVVYMDQDKQVTVVYPNVPGSQPGVEESETEHRSGYGKYFLELRAGEAARLNIKKGIRLDFKLPGE